MTIVKPAFEFMSAFDGRGMLKRIERIARVCYKSEANIACDTAEGFVRGIIASGHESVIEHETVTVKLMCDRGVSHEIVRHRIASYSQESTRYCKYSAERFGGGLVFIRPFFWEEGGERYAVWLEAMRHAEEAYLRLTALGAKAEEARSVLPNSLKTELVMTMNLREWRHFFALRAAKQAHPQMREIAAPLLAAFRERIPVIFDTIPGIV